MTTSSSDLTLHINTDNKRKHRIREIVATFDKKSSEHDLNKDSQLAFADDEIEAGAAQFVRIGLGLNYVNEHKLFLLVGYSSVSEFALQRYGMKAHKCSRFRTAAEFGRLIAKNFPDSNFCESQIRELRPLLKAKKTKEALNVWEDIYSENGKVTATKIRDHSVVCNLRNESEPSSNKRPKTKTQIIKTNLEAFRSQIDSEFGQGSTDKLIVLLA